MYRRNRTHRAWLPAAAAILALTGAAATAHAQFNSSLTGTVQDPTGAVVPGATITLTNTGTQQAFNATSSGDGTYRFTTLPPATYKLHIDAAGFRATDIANVDVVAETARNVDVKLQTGGATEAVTVNADTLPVLQTDDAQIGRTISQEEIQRLPIFGADPYELLRTAPGITGNGARSGTGQAVFLPNNVGPGGSNSGIFQTENQIQISADGQRVADNNILIDGVSVNSLTHGGSAVVTPNQESISSISVTSTSYDAADGRNTGAQVKSTTKSGTNDVHGSLFLLYDEPGLNSFNTYAGPTSGASTQRVQLKQRTYAASLGGPIVKNKLFVFGSFQGYGQSNNTVSSPTYVETSQYRAAVIAQRQGSLAADLFSSFGIAPRIHNLVQADCSLFANNAGTVANPGVYYPKQVNDQGPVVAQTAQNGPYCQVVPGGIDTGSLTSGSAMSNQNAYLAAFSNGNPAAPGPKNKVGGSLVGGGLDGVPDFQYAQLAVPSHSRGNQFEGRVDFQATKKDLVAGSIFVTKLDNVSSTDKISRQIGDVPFKPLNEAATLIYIHTFSSSWLNEFRTNGTRFYDNGLTDVGSINLGEPYTYIDQSLPFGPDFGGVQGGATTPQILAQNTIEINDQATHTFGSHAIKFGGGYRWEQDNDNQVGAARPDYDFAGPWNLANDAPFFESQTVNPATGLAPATAAHFRSETLYTYVQHDWKVKQNFTFNAGFRYEIQTPWHRKGGAPSYLPIPGTGPGGPQIGLTLQPVQNLYNTDYGHYEPRLAFAWNPNLFANKFVVRGGFSTAYNHLNLSLFNNTIQNGPGQLQFGVCCGTSTLDFSTPFDNNQISYSHGKGSDLNSFKPNPAFTTGISPSGFPYSSVGAGATPAQIEIYGVGTKIRNPVSYLYSLDTETLLPGNVSLTVGYAGALGRHYARLVNQNYLYPISYTAPGSATSVNSLASNDYLAQTDSSEAYNALNVHMVKHVQHGFSFDGTYTWSKGMDNITNGDQSDGAANQTDPANNRAEWGPSDNDIRNRFTGVALYNSPKFNLHNKILEALTNGYQGSMIVTLQSGFRWTPSVNNPFALPNSATVNTTRPIAYAPGSGAALIGQSCSNAALQSGSNFPNRSANGGGLGVFSTAAPTTSYVPVVNRNSQTGPCYRDVDLSLAKQVSFEGFGHTALLRFQANLFNAFNLTQLQPITNEASNTNIKDPNFGKSLGSDAGRVVEFQARIQF